MPFEDLTSERVRQLLLTLLREMDPEKYASFFAYFTFGAGSGILLMGVGQTPQRELEDAVQVSPYDTDGLAAALHRSLTMAPEERARRMRALREVVASQNIYDWARKILRDTHRLGLGPGSAKSKLRP